jgi:hypothetical protein
MELEQTRDFFSGGRAPKLQAGRMGRVNAEAPAFPMGLWATTVETARAGLAGVRIKQGTEGAASAVRRVPVLRRMFLHVFLLRLMGFISKANTTRFQKKHPNLIASKQNVRASQVIIVEGERSATGST